MTTAKPKSNSKSKGAALSLDSLKRAIIEAGSDHEPPFGSPEREDGPYIPQDPGEFAEALLYLVEHVPPPELSIDIGIASGGQTKMMRDWFPRARTIVVDRGAHPKHIPWRRMLE